MTNPDLSREAIRIGTMVDGRGPDPARYITQILPHGFESFQISFWQTLGRVNLKELAHSVRDALGDSGAGGSSLAVFGNPLATDSLDMQTLHAWEAAIDAAGLFGAGIVAGFTGRVRGRPIDESLPRFKEVFGPLARRAADNGVRVAFENCPMEGNWKTGDWNIAHQPKAWEKCSTRCPTTTSASNGNRRTSSAS